MLNIFEYAFNTNPKLLNPSPVAYSLASSHLTIIFQRAHPAPQDITYLFEVADGLLSGIWHSGPAFTTQSVTDNHDGTETVTVTDNAAVPSSAAHYLRLRISRP